MHRYSTFLRIITLVICAAGIAGAQEKAPADTAKPADTIRPEVTAVSLEPGGTVRTGTLSVSVSFSEEMKRDVAPRVGFGDRKPFRTVLFKGEWKDGKTWTGSCTVSPKTMNGTNTVSIDQAQDLAGNAVKKHADKTFLVDTQAPTVSSADVSAENGLQGVGTVKLIITFDEKMDQGTAPTVQSGIAKPFSTLTFKGSWQNGMQWAGETAVTGEAPNGTHTISVSGAKDAAGNDQKASQKARFTVDTEAPTVKTAVCNPVKTGPGQVLVRIEMSEPVNRQVPLTVSLGTKEPFTALAVTGSWQSDVQWEGTAEVAASAENGTYKMRISGGADPAGNGMKDETRDGITVDTRAPVLEKAATGDTGLVMSGTVPVELAFSEEMDRKAALKVTAQPDGDGKAVPAAGKWISDTAWKGSITFTRSAANGQYRLMVGGGADVTGNPMKPFRKTLCRLDSKPPEVTGAEWDKKGVLGAGTSTILLTFSEPMNTKEAVAVSLGQKPPFKDVTVSGAFEDATRWKGTLALTGKVPGGTYTLVVSGGKDAAGNGCEEYKAGGIVIDTKAPAVTKLETEPAGVIGAGECMISVTFSEPMDAAVPLKVAFGEKGAFTVAGDWVETRRWQGMVTIGTQHTDGTQPVTVSGGKDPAGNPQEPGGAYTITIDKTPPAVASATVGDGKTLGRGTHPVKISFSEAMDGKQPPAVTFGPESTPDAFTVAGAWTASDTWEGSITVAAGTPAGKNILTVGGAADKAGNLMQADKSHSFTADPVPPVVSGIVRTPEGAVGPGTVKVVCTFSEEMDQTRQPKMAAGSMVFAGSWTDGKTWSGELAVAADAPNGEQRIALEGAADKAGNAIEKQTVTSVLIDTRAPDTRNASVTIGDGAGVTNSKQVPFSFSGFTDAGSGIAGYFWSSADGGGTDKGTSLDGMEGVLPTEKDGPVTVFVWAKDKAGNISGSVSASVTVDTRSPRVTGVKVEGPELKKAGPVSVAVSFSEPLNKQVLPVVTFGAGAPYTAHVLTGSLSAESTLTVTGTIPDEAVNGAQRILVSGGADRAGNLLTADTSGAFTVDTRSPVCSGVTIDKQSPVSPGPLAVKAVFDESMDREKVLKVTVAAAEGGTAPINVSGSWQDEKNWQGTCTLTADMPGGAHTVVVRGGTDVAGNVMDPDRSLSFDFDTSPPEVVSVVTEPEGIVAAGSVMVVVTFSEALDPAAAPAVTCGPEAPYDMVTLAGAMREATVWQGVFAVVPGMANGDHTLAVRNGKDAAGNMMKEYTGTTLTVDTEPPQLTAAMVALEGGAAATNKRDLALTVTGVSDGKGAGVAKLYYHTEDKGGTREGTVFAVDGTTVSAAQDGRFTVYVWAEDKVGNIGSAVPVSIMIDATPPAITGMEAASPTPESDGGFAVKLFFSEPVQTGASPVITAGAAAPYDREGVFRDGSWINDSTWQMTLVMDSLMRGERLGLSVKGVTDKAGNVMAGDQTQRLTLPALCYFYYGSALAQAGRNGAALRALDACLELRPGYTAAYMIQAGIYNASGQGAKAVEVYRKALAVDPLDARLYTRLAGLLTGLGRSAEALQVSRHGLLVNSAAAERMIPYRALPVTEILPGYLDYRADDYTMFNTSMTAGLACAASDDHAAARDHFAAAVKVNDDSPAAHYNLGRAAYAAGDAAGAATELYQALGQDSTLQEAAVLLGVIAAGRDSLREASEHYRTVTRPDLGWMARANTAVLAARSGDPAKAAGILEKVYRDHTDGSVAYNLGVVLKAAGAIDRALASYRKAGADNALAACQRGVILLARGDYDGAAGELTRSLAMEPAQAEAACAMGLLNQQRGFLEEAELWYQRAVVFDPEYMEAYANLGIIYGKMGKASKEKASYARAHSLKKKRQEQTRAAAGSDTRPVAITSFDNVSGEAAYDWLRVGIAEALTSDLKEMANLNLVERLKVEKTMQEMALAATDIMADKAGEMGKLTGAQLIISGSFQMAGGEIKIDARLIEVATGEVKSATSARGQLDSIFAVQRSLAVHLLNEMGVKDAAALQSGVRHARSLDALRYLSEGRTSFYKGDREGSMENMRKAAELDESFRDALVDMELESNEEKAQRTLAVMSFGNASGEEKYGWMGGGIAEALTTDLRKVTGLFLVERMALNTALNELHLGKTDIVDDKSAPRIGKLVGAGAVIMGSYQVAADNVRIDARMVEVASGKILMTETVQGSVDDLYDLEEQLAFKIADVLNISVSIAEREQIARSADPTAQALKNIALSQSGTAEDAPVEEADKALALVPFKNNCGTDARRYEWMQQSIQDVMTTEFQQSGLVRLVDRQVMQVQLGEAALEGLVGMDDLERSMRKLIPADFLLQGGYQVVGDKLRIDSRLVEVESGSILFSESASGGKDDILGVQLDLSGKILASIRKSARGKTGGGSVVLSGNERYKTPTLWVAGGAGLASVLTTVSHVLYRGAADEYRNATASFDETADRAERYLQTRNFLIGTMVTAWTAAGSSYLWNKYIRARFLEPARSEPSVAAVAEGGGE